MHQHRRIVWLKVFRSFHLLYPLVAMQFSKALIALAAVFGAVFQLQGCGAATTEAPAGNTSNSTRMLEDAELLA